ncbi:MAG: hypothetical protein WCI31_14445, partial [Prolixibacteraceae bacterium]
TNINLAHQPFWFNIGEYYIPRMIFQHKTSNLPQILASSWHKKSNTYKSPCKCLIMKVFSAGKPLCGRPKLLAN